SFTVTSNRNLVANFSLNAYTIATSSNPTEGGTTTGAGNYDFGDTATVNATAAEGYTFINWTENGTPVSTNAEYSFTVTGNRSLVANFSLNAYTITTSSNPTEGGTTTGDGTYNYGETAALIAVPNQDYLFVNWTENGNEVSTEANYEFIVDSDRDLVANFEPIMSVWDADNAKITLYPNPFTDFIMLNVGNAKIQEIHFYDFSGRLLSKQKGNELNEMQINTQKLEKGKYILRVFTDKGDKSFKVIKK
ncbi:MAG: T9SS type A sorting domain-containing protein, partial [Weeksellaceae bacterium]